MLFSALFALAALDALVNGPKLEGPRPYVAAVCALVATLLNHVYGFLAAEAVFILLFAEASYLERRRREEEKIAEAKRLEKPAAAEKVNALPENALNFLRQAKEDFLKNLGIEVNLHNQPWKVLASSDGVTISQSDFPGQKCKFWKVECEVVGELERIKKELMDYSIRVTWDSAVQSGKILRTFDKTEIGEPFITLMYTAPAAGGMVSPRELVDFGLLIDKEGAFDYVYCSIPKEFRFPELPTKVTGERGFMHKGSGMRLENIPGTNKFKYVLINALDLGGWLPASVINTATTGALTDGTKAMMAHLEKIARAN